MIAALGLLVGVVLGLIFTPDVPAGLDPYLPIAVVAALDAVFGGAARLPRRHLRRQGLRRLVLQQRRHRGRDRLPRRQARRRRAAVHRRDRGARHPDLLQRRRDPAVRLPCLRPDDRAPGPARGAASEAGPSRARTPSRPTRPARDAARGAGAAPAVAGAGRGRRAAGGARLRRDHPGPHQHQPTTATPATASRTSSTCSPGWPAPPSAPRPRSTGSRATRRQPRDAASRQQSAALAAGRRSRRRTLGDPGRRWSRSPVPASGSRSPRVRSTVDVDSVLDTIEELRSAGAEAMQVNGKVRLVAQSSVQSTPVGHRDRRHAADLAVRLRRDRRPAHARRGALSLIDGPIAQFQDAGATVDVAGAEVARHHRACTRARRRSSPSPH